MFGSWRYLWSLFIVIPFPEIDKRLGLCIVYFKRYDTYHDTHEVIFDMYQRYIWSGFKPNKLIYPQISWEFWYFNDQNILNLSKNVSFEVSCN